MWVNLDYPRGDHLTNRVLNGAAGNPSRLTKFGDPIDREPHHRWHGHRVLLLDATSFSMPDTPELQAHFGQPGRQSRGCGFPVAHVRMLFNDRTGLAMDAIIAPLRTHEMSIATGTHQRMPSSELVVGDDSFGTYAHFTLLRPGRASRCPDWHWFPIVPIAIRLGCSSDVPNSTT